MTQCNLVMAKVMKVMKSTFNEESKPLVIDRLTCPSSQWQSGYREKMQEQANTIASSLPMILNEGISRKNGHIRYLSGHTVVHKHTQWDVVVHRHRRLNINHVTQEIQVWRPLIGPVICKEEQFRNSPIQKTEWINCTNPLWASGRTARLPRQPPLKRKGPKLVSRDYCSHYETCGSKRYQINQFPVSL